MAVVGAAREGPLNRGEQSQGALEGIRGLMHGGHEPGGRKLHLCPGLGAGEQGALPQGALAGERLALVTRMGDRDGSGAGRCTIRSLSR
jgi:hypothetical protein